MSSPASLPRPETSRSVRPFIYVWLCYSLLLLLGVRVLLFSSGFTERMDFRQLYAAGYLLRTDPANLYDYERQKEVQDTLVSRVEGVLPFIRPAYEAALFAPLSRFAYRTAYLTFVCCNLLLIAVCFFVCPEALAQPGTAAQPRSGLQLFAFFPVTVAILQGQDSIVMLLGLCLVYRALKVTRHFAAGLLLSLLLFKFQIALPVAVFLAVRFGAMILAGLVVGGVLVSAVSIAATSWRTFASFGHALSITGAATLAKDSPNGILGVVPSAMPNLKGLISGVTFGLVSGKVILVSILVFSVVVTLWIAARLRSQQAATELAVSWAVTGAALLSYYMHLQDLTVLQLPLGFMAREKNAIIARASWLFYVAPPVVVMVSRGAICLLSLLLVWFLYGMAQVPSQTRTDPNLVPGT